MRKRNRLLASMLALMISVLSYAQGLKEVVINEIMQSNIDGLMVNGDFPDSWVELYNATDRDVNVGKYRIGEKNEWTKGYVIPDNTYIPAKGHLLLFCDKENMGLHTSFRIDAGKASLFLFDAEGRLLDSLSVDDMPSPEIAYGRVVDGADDWHYELTASPGEANKGGGSDMVLPDPVFSVRGGVFSNALSVTISVPDGVPLPEGTRLYITVDGKEPTVKSRSVEKSQMFSVTSSMVFRAKLISPNALSPRSVTQSYIFHPRKLDMPVVSLVTDASYFNSQQYGILASSVHDGVPNYMRKWRRPLNVEYFSSATEEESYFNQLAEVAVSGVSTREQPQKSLKLYANKRFGKKSFKGSFWGDKPEVRKVKSFVLRCGGNNSFGSRVNDALVQTLFGTNVDNLDWQAYQPVVVYLNGEYMGEYGMRERADEDYVESNYPDVEDVEMADEKSYQTPTEGSLFRDLYSLYKRCDVTYDEMAESMDVDNFVKSLIAEIYGQNTDFPTNNVSMWRPVLDGGKWRWILKDMDRFGVISVLHPLDYDMIDYMFGSKDIQYDGMGHFNLYRKMISFPEFRERFIQLFTVYLGDFLQSDKVMALLDSLQNDVYEELKATFSLYAQSMTSYNVANRGLKEIIRLRPSHLYGQLAKHFELGRVFDMTVSSDMPCLRMYGVELKDGSYNGSCYSDYPVSLDSGDPSVGWKLRMKHTNGVEEEVVFSEPVISVLPSEYVTDKDDYISFFLETYAIQQSDDVNAIGHASHKVPSTGAYTISGRKANEDSMEDGKLYIRDGKKVIRL